VDALGGHAVEPRDHGKQIGTQALRSRKLSGIDDVVHTSMVA
jgi:hypothetical protein